MAEITHNKANKKTGKPMSAVGQRASFLKYFGDAVKGTAVEGLYLCGAGTHPGGSVIAINGRNAAMEILGTD